MTFGIEEEFVLLDAKTLHTVDVAARAVADLAGGEDGAGVVREFFPSQLEYVSPVLASSIEAHRSVIGFRSRLAAWARDSGVIAAGVATPYRARLWGEITEDDRYGRIAADIGGLAPRHQINGLHVHIGIEDRDHGVQVSNFLRRWLPTLLALSANSPFWHGTDTGFQSWRAIHSRRWTTYGIPPAFRDADDYARQVSSLEGIGATSDEGTINWNIRLSRSHPTVEVRVFDAQLDGTSAVALALLVRALAEIDEEHDATDPGSLILDAALWHSARFGLTNRVFDATTCRMENADDVIASLWRMVGPQLERAGDTARVESFLARLGQDGTPSVVQRVARAKGVDRLTALYRDRLPT